MTRRPFRTALLLHLACVTAVEATEPVSLSFQHKDWEIACDNTRTCRAAGYQADGTASGVSVLVTRAAGPHQAPRIQLELASNEAPTPDAVQMQVGDRQLGSVKLDGEAKGELNPAQASALLAALLTNVPIRWNAKSAGWTLSSAGANAVLLKMDEFQGRLQTPGALVRKGTKDETAVLPSLPAPELIAVKVGGAQADARLIPKKQAPALVAALRATLGEIDENSCEDFNKHLGELQAYRLSEQQMLVTVGCWVAAYNSGAAYWVVNAQAPYAPVLVTNRGTDYDAGRIDAIHKGRGIGDCMSSDAWTWDGRHFVHTSSLTTGMWKEIAAGGAWELPTLVTNVKRPE